MYLYDDKEKVEMSKFQANYDKLNRIFLVIICILVMFDEHFFGLNNF